MMKQTNKTLVILLAVCFVLSMTAISASADDHHHKDDGHHHHDNDWHPWHPYHPSWHHDCKWNYHYHRVTCEWKWY
jgi:hypothetical protein